MGENVGSEGKKRAQEPNFEELIKEEAFIQETEKELSE